MWEKAKQDPRFQQWLLNYISCTVYECMPKEVIDEGDSLRVGHWVFQPLLCPDSPDFDDIMQLDVSDIVHSCQMHSRHHMAMCFKYGSKRCRSWFPHEIVPETSFNEIMCIIRVRRDHAWLNGYNKWISFIMRANHDCQFLFTKNHALTIIHYIMKYISKPEAALHSKLTIAATVRKALPTTLSSSTIDPGRNMILKTCNKLDSHREVGIPEAISHLLDFPDHYTDKNFQHIHMTLLLQYFKGHLLRRYIHLRRT